MARAVSRGTDEHGGGHGRLGADVHFLGRLSRDSFGAQLRDHIQKANVALDLTTESSQSTVNRGREPRLGGRSQLHLPLRGNRELRLATRRLAVLDADDWLHIASLACVVRPGSEVLLDWTQPAGPGCPTTSTYGRR